MHGVHMLYHLSLLKNISKNLRKPPRAISPFLLKNISKNSRKAPHATSRFSIEK
jgi:hypothetical protein